MRSLSVLFFLIHLTLVVCMLSCKEEKGEVTAGNAITGSLSLTGIAGATVESDASGANYTFTVPAGTNVKSLVLSIPLASGSKIDPAPEVARDYTNPVTYAITKTDGSKQMLTVKVVVLPGSKSSEKQITAFSFAGLSPAVTATIDHNTKKITATVSSTTDITKLVPTIAVSAKATVSPASGLVQNFTSAVNYTVTAEDGSKQVYEVKVEKGAVSGNTTFNLITAGELHSLLVKSDNSVWGTGMNSEWQLGDGTRAHRYIPYKIWSEASVQEMAGGRYHSLVVMKDNTLWGMGYFPGLGLNGGGQAPVKIMSGVQSVAAAGDIYNGSCTYILKTDRSLWTVGSNMDGQLGDGTRVAKSTPIQIMTDVMAISLSTAHGLILKTDHTLWAVGENGWGQFGDGTRLSKYVPVKIMTEVKAISAGAQHSLILKDDNTLWVTGDNTYGQLGDGSSVIKSTPVRIATDVKAMAAGGAFSMVLKNDNSLWSVGSNEVGQLGDGTRVSKSSLVKIMTDVKAVSSGSSHSLVLKTDGSVWVFGFGSFGQLGISVEELTKYGGFLSIPTRLNIP